MADTRIMAAIDREWRDEMEREARNDHLLRGTLSTSWSGAAALALAGAALTLVILGLAVVAHLL